MNLTMPTVLAWVLGGNVSNLADARASFCRTTDQPRGFNHKDFRTFLKDDDALIRASKASWLLLPATATNHLNAGKTCCCSLRHAGRQILELGCHFVGNHACAMPATRD